MAMILGGLVILAKSARGAKQAMSPMLNNSIAGNPESKRMTLYLIKFTFVLARDDGGWDVGLFSQP